MYHRLDAQVIADLSDSVCVLAWKSTDRAETSSKSTVGDNHRIVPGAMDVGLRAGQTPLDVRGGIVLRATVLIAQVEVATGFAPRDCASVLCISYSRHDIPLNGKALCFWTSFLQDMSVTGWIQLRNLQISGWKLLLESFVLIARRPLSLSSRNMVK